MEEVNSQAQQLLFDRGGALCARTLLDGTLSTIAICKKVCLMHKFALKQGEQLLAGSSPSVIKSSPDNKVTGGEVVAAWTEMASAGI